MARWIGTLIIAFCCLTLTAHAGNVTGKIVGKVTNSKGEPLEGVHVTMQNTQVETLVFEEDTNAKGVFTLVGLEPVNHKIKLEKEGYIPLEGMVKIRAGGKVRWEAKMMTMEELIALTPVAPEEMARREFNKAADLYNAGKLEEAKKALSTALEHNPKLAAAYQLLATIDLREKQYETALTHLDKVLELESQNADALYLKGAALNSLGRQDEAVTTWQSYLALKPDDAEIRYNVGALLLAAKKTDEAIEHFKAALKAKPDFADACKVLGQLYIQKAQHADAKAMLQRYLELKPDAADADEIRQMVEILP
jgi:tetratricopeptide (TPR) repeat protein